MKMKQEDYETLKGHIDAVVAAYPGACAEYRDAALSHKRYRWDMLWRAKISDFTCNTLYKYLNDDHIDTALRSILGADYPPPPDTKPS